MPAKNLRRQSFAINIALLGVSIWIALLSVFTVASRFELSTSIDGTIESINADLSARVAKSAEEASAQATLLLSSTPSEFTAPASGAASGSGFGSQTFPRGVESLPDVQALVLRKIGYERARQIVSFMHIHGESEVLDLACITEYLDQLTVINIDKIRVSIGPNCRNKNVIPTASAVALTGTSASTSATAITGVTIDSDNSDAGGILGIDSIVGKFSRVGNISHLPSNILLAIGVIFAAGVGSLSAELRRQKPATLVQYAVGISGGFIAYLAIKGGSFLVVSPAQRGISTLNPYGVALVGVLVGLFSDRAYALIQELVDDVTDRLTRQKPDSGTEVPVGVSGAAEESASDSVEESVGSESEPSDPARA